MASDPWGYGRNKNVGWLGVGMVSTLSPKGERRDWSGCLRSVRTRSSLRQTSQRFSEMNEKLGMEMTDC